MRDELEAKGMPAVEIRKQLDRKFPPYPVNHNQVQSVAHGSTRVIQIEADGSLTQEVLMKKTPKTQEDADALRERVRQNPPFIFGRLVSLDERGALITAGFVTDRLTGREVYTAVFNHIEKIKKDLETDDIKIYITGQPILVGWVIKYAFEILAYVTATVVTIFGLLWLYFRRWHGVVIPAIAAMVTVIWGLGFTGWKGIAFDPLILVIPMIITARAVSHTVQMAERFFEDYEVMLPRLRRSEAARASRWRPIAMGELVCPGTLGIVTDVAGLLVIMLTTIPQMYNLGLFGAVWVSSIIVTVEILHPILICYMPAPTEHEHFLPAFMLRFMRGVGWATTDPFWKYVIGGVTVVPARELDLHHALLFEDRRGDAGHAAALAEARVQRRDGADRDALRRRRFAGGLFGRRSTERQRRRGADQGDGAIRARSEGQHEPRRLGVAGAVPAQLLADQPLRRSEVVLRAVAPRHGARGDLPAPAERPARRHAARSSPTTGAGRTSPSIYPDHQGETIIRTTHFAEEFIEQNPLGEVSIRLDMDKAAPGRGLLRQAEAARPLVLHARADAARRAGTP